MFERWHEFFRPKVISWIFPRQDKVRGNNMLQSRCSCLPVYLFSSLFQLFRISSNAWAYRWPAMFSGLKKSWGYLSRIRNIFGKNSRALHHYLVLHPNFTIKKPTFKNLNICPFSAHTRNWYFCHQRDWEWTKIYHLAESNVWSSRQTTENSRANQVISWYSNLVEK